MPTQKISTEPTIDRFHRADAVISGYRSVARRVRLPCRMPTGMAGNIHPLPIAQVIIIMIIKSYHTIPFF